MLPGKQKHSCGQWFSVGDKFCPHCGQINNNYDSAKADLLRASHRKGWRKVDIAPAPAEDDLTE